MLGNFSCFCCGLLTFFKLNFFNKIFSGTLPECQNSLDPDQDIYSVGPDLGPNCLQRLSGDDKSSLVGKELLLILDQKKIYLNSK